MLDLLSELHSEGDCGVTAAYMQNMETENKQSKTLSEDEEKVLKTTYEVRALVQRLPSPWAVAHVQWHKLTTVPIKTQRQAVTLRRVQTVKSYSKYCRWVSEPHPHHNELRAPASATAQPHTGDSRCGSGPFIFAIMSNHIKARPSSEWDLQSVAALYLKLCLWVRVTVRSDEWCIASK